MTYNKTYLDPSSQYDAIKKIRSSYTNSIFKKPLLNQNKNNLNNKTIHNPYIYEVETNTVKSLKLIAIKQHFDHLQNKKHHLSYLYKQDEIDDISIKKRYNHHNLKNKIHDDTKTIEFSHKIINQYRDNLTVQVKINSQIDLKCLQIYNSSIAYDNKVNLIDIKLNQKTCLTVSREYVTPEFYKYGLLAVLDLYANQELVLVYNLRINSQGKYNEQISFCTKLIGSIASDLEVEIQYPTSRSIFEYVKVSLYSDKFGESIKFKDSENNYSLKLFDWNGCNNVYNSFQYVLKSNTFQIDYIEGYTSKGIAVPIEINNTCDTSILGRIETPIGRKFTDCNLPNSSLFDIKSVVFYLRYIRKVYYKSDLLKETEPLPLDAVDELDQWITHLSIICDTIIDDYGNNRDSPSHSVILNIQTLCQMLKDAKYIKGYDLDNSTSKAPLLFGFYLNNCLLYRKEIYARDDNNIYYSIISLKHDGVKYINESPKAITYLFAINSLINFLTSIKSRNKITNLS